MGRVTEDASDDTVIWARPEYQGRGPAPKHSRAEIAEAAVTIADAEGIDAVSMRKVAAAIGAGTMSLYRYVHNKDELYALMVESIMDVGDHEWHARSDWRDELRRLAWGVRALTLEHPWYPALAAGVTAPSPTMVRGLEHAMSVMDGLGLDIDEMLEIVTTVMTFASGMAQDQLAERQAVLRSGVARHEWQSRHAPYIRSLIEDGEHPYLRRIVMDAKIPHEDDENRFARAVDRLVAGIAATIPNS
jgi:AcrR family transcriptional regulator